MAANNKSGKSKFKFSSKADVLQALKRHPQLNIPPFHSFDVASWNNDRKSVLDACASAFGGGLLAVRSSSKREDTENASGAGAFLSALNVDGSDAKKLEEAIESVIASYGEASADDQVLIQRMVANPSVTGVIMTRAVADGSPYYVINYDDESGKTDSVTGGSTCSKTVHVFRGVRDKDFDSPRLRSFVELARQLEKICGTDALDIEFCLDKENVLHLLQARPICSWRNWPKDRGEISGHIDQIAKFIEDRSEPAETLFGQRTALGVMPDWNPAEMIGILPRPLASSLYRHLITSRVWSQARSAMGYRHIPSTDLMLLVMGRPYIDVRASFNSFLPQGLDGAVCEALVSAWLDRLENFPQLHDKVEFDIAQTSLDFCFDQHLDERYPGLLPYERRINFRRALRDLTQNCLDLSPSGSLNRAMEAIFELRLRQSGRPLPRKDKVFPLSSVNGLLEECREYGTLPFSILARHAFIAESFLRSAAAREALAPERVQEFKLSVQTISGELSDEFLEVCQGQRDPQNFLRKYGHLRPGTYDILSPRYADRDSLFVMTGNSEKAVQREFALETREKEALARLLAQNDLDIAPEELLEYARKAIQGRELAKFIFTRNLSDALEIMASWGASLGFSRDDVSFMELEPILDQKIRVLPENPASWFGDYIKANKKTRAKSQALKLGYIIRSASDVYIAPQHRSAPNFTGASEALAETAVLDASASCDEDIEGKIVCVENADPGFDWIFTRRIAGLVTQFGGANSHMAIRCAEYGLPAAIGVGSQMFEKIVRSNKLLLNPSAAILKIQQ